MAIFFRRFKIEEEGGKEIIFKHYPNQSDLIDMEKDDMDISLHARQDMLKMISVVHDFMSDNTIHKVEIEEGTEE